MNAPNRSAAVTGWVASHRALFVGDADATTRALLTPLAQFLNLIEGRDVWGLLVKTDRTPPVIPHDILMWKDTREHFDVFTGPDSGKAEDVQAVWGEKGVATDPRWIWQSVGDVITPVPVDPPTDPPLTLEQRLETAERRTIELDKRLGELTARLDTLVHTPPPPFPALIVEGDTGRAWGHAHRLRLTVRPA